MSQADALLNSLTDDEIAAYTADYITEEHIVIGNDRFITVPESLKRIAVQHDHNIETVTFDCPRYWDGHDMSKMAVYINYQLPSGVMGGYIAENISVDANNSNIMHFTWTISNAITAYKGNISFLVCIKKTDSEGDLTNHWNSELCKDMYVSEGLEADVEFAELYSDMVTQLLLRMTAVEEINIQASEMRQLLVDTESAASDAVNSATSAQIALEAVNAKDESIRNSYANAIKGTAKGEVIRVDDVSPVEHTVKAVVRGKNLVPFGTLEFTKNKNITLDKPIPAGTYTISAYITSDDTDGELSSVSINSGNAVLKYLSLNRNERVYSTFTVSSPITNIDFCAAYNYSTGLDDTATWSDIQLEESSIATEYEPYIDPSTVLVTACGKNVLELSGTKNQNGVTMTVSDTGLVTIKGTTTAAINLNVGNGFMKAGYKYKPTIQIINGSTYPSFWNFETQSNIYKDGNGYLSSEVDTAFSAFVYAASAGTVYDGAFKIMVELVNDSTDDTFDKGSNATYTPATDGTVEITSVNPTMTVFTDTPGAMVDLEYNRDTTKAMTSYIFTEEIKNEIAAKVESDMEEVLIALNDYVDSLNGGDA